MEIINYLPILIVGAIAMIALGYIGRMIKKVWVYICMTAVLAGVAWGICQNLF